MTNKTSISRRTLVGGYAIEGHVPAQDGPAYDNRKDPFDVLLLTRDGGSKLFQRYPGNAKA